MRANRPWLLPAGRAQWRNALARIAAALAVLLTIPVVSLMWCTCMPGSSWDGPLPPLDDPGVVLRANVERHVRTLAGTIGERHINRPAALRAAAAYVRAQLESYGATVTEQRYIAAGVEVANIEAVLPGTSLSEEIVVVGAHYDSARGTPGADDNATGVAAVLELARLLRGVSHPRTIRLVAFVNEEPPYFQDAGMGSLEYARACRARDDQIVAMLALEMLGYYDPSPGAQSYPPPLQLLYPDSGAFIAFVGNLSSRTLVRRAVQLFRANESFPSEGLAGPTWVHGVGFSDHWSFWQHGYPGVMVTDTAFLRTPHYHEPTDTPDTVDYDHVARVTRGVASVVTGLARP